MNNNNDNQLLDVNLAKHKVLLSGKYCFLIAGPCILSAINIYVTNYVLHCYIGILKSKNVFKVSN